MSITLNATLKTAQDGIGHRPVVNLLTSPMEAAIPFRGNYFNTGSDTETNFDSIITSEGRLITLYQRGDEDLYYYYTDEDRTEWQIPVRITGLDAEHASLCEMTDGNIGIVYKLNEELKYVIVTPTGSTVSSGTISTGHGWLGGVSVITLANDTYLLVYAEGDAAPPGSSDNYYLQKRTSSDFTSWSAPSAITLTGLDVTYYKNNPDLLQLTGGRIYLHFDYLDEMVNDVEIRNIYRTISDDNGPTWSAPVAITEFDTAGSQGINPSAAEKDDGNITLTYAQVNNVMRYKNMDGSDDVDWVGNAFVYDAAEQLIIGLNHDAWFTTPSVMAIDTATHTFLKYWDLSTSPAMKAGFQDQLFNRNQASKYPFYVFYAYEVDGESGWCDDAVQVLNYEQDSVTKYQTRADFNIGHIGAYGYDWFTNLTPFVRLVSESDRRLYLAYSRDGAGISGPEAFLLGYLDLDEVADPITGKYTWNEVAYIECENDAVPGFRFGSISNIWWEDSLQKFIITTHGYGDVAAGGVALLNESGTITHAWNYLTKPGLPTGGPIRAVYVCNDTETLGSIWFTFDNDAEHPDRRGLCRFSLDIETSTYHLPNWFTCTSGSCGFSSLEVISDDRILMVCSQDGCDKGGIVIFDTTDFSWTVYNNTTLPGMWTGGVYAPVCNAWTNDEVVVQYDPSTETIYAAYPGNHLGTQIRQGIIFFSELGAYSILKYLTVTSPDSSPSYGSPETLSYYSFEYNPAIAIDADGYAWFIWDHMDSVYENSLQWANTMSDKQVEDYLINNSVLQIEWEVDKPNKLTFELSHGYLFDPLNYSSIWSVYFKMGRVITLQLGETVSDVDYLQAQGEFVVKESSLVYGKDYPKIKIVAEDLRSLWEDTHIITSEYFSDSTPKSVTENLLLDHGGLTGSDYDIPTYINTHNLFHQFVDMDLDEAIQLIMDHFGYFGFVNVDGKFEPRRVRFSGTPDHTYTGIEIIEFTPDNSYATWTNRVIVTGMSNIYSEILYELESIKSISGTVGHWGGDKDLTVYYSDDKQRTCRDPRLEIIMSVSEFQVWGIKGGGSEEISSIDSDEQYIVITIEIPDLTGLLIAAIAAIVALGAACISCDGVITGWCGACIFAITVLLNLVLLILGAVASYSYTIWARPIGHERATFQSQPADDIEFQRQLNGKIISEIIDDPFCYTIPSCQTVADFELNVAMSQRRRLKFKKVGHLMDEIGDILRVNHPYSAENIDSVVTKLKRSVKIGGEITDDIEGWRLS